MMRIHHTKTLPAMICSNLPNLLAAFVFFIAIAAVAQTPPTCPVQRYELGAIKILFENQPSYLVTGVVVDKQGGGVWFCSARFDASQNSITSYQCPRLFVVPYRGGSPQVISPPHEPINNIYVIFDQTSAGIYICNDGRCTSPPVYPNDLEYAHPPQRPAP